MSEYSPTSSVEESDNEQDHTPEEVNSTPENTSVFEVDNQTPEENQESPIRGEENESEDQNERQNDSAAESSAESQEAGGEFDEDKLGEMLNSDNRSRYERMSDGGKQLAQGIYEKLYKIPVLNRMVGKLEIAYQSFWLKRHQEKAVKFKNKIDGLDLQVKAMEQTQEEMKKQIALLAEQGISGASLELKIQEIEGKKAKIQERKDGVRTKFDVREDKLKIRANNRDRIAGQLIEYYDGKLEPMEKKLEELNTTRDEIDLVEAVNTARHNEDLARLDELQNQRDNIVELLRRTGMSDREISNNEAILELDGTIAQGHANIKADKADVAKRREAVNKSIAKLDAKANPHRDKREAFVRVTKLRPIDFNMTTREQGKASDDYELTQGRTRPEEQIESPQTTSAPENIEATASTEQESRRSISQGIENWNRFLQEHNQNQQLAINPNEFMSQTRLSADFRPSAKDFENIVIKYFKLKKVPQNLVNDAIKYIHANNIIT